MGEADVDTLYFKAKELQRIRNYAQRIYTILYIIRFFNPVYFFINIFPKINNWEGLKYFFKSIKSQIKYVIKKINSLRIIFEI